MRISFSKVELIAPSGKSTIKSASKLFESATSPSNLKRLYIDYVERKTAYGRDGIRPGALAKDIDSTAKLISRKLRMGKYRFTGYRELLVLKGAGKAPRILSIPTARDRIALRSLAECLGKLFPGTGGAIPQQRVFEVMAAIETGAFDSYVKLDIENFYPSIEHAIVEERLRTKIRKKEIIAAFLGAIKTPTVPPNQPSRTANNKGVPQGLAISNMIAELVMRDVDGAIAGSEKSAYFRYVDDILILCDSTSVESIRDNAVVLCKKIGLRVHATTKGGAKSSSGAISDGFSYLGYTFNERTVSVREQSVRNIEGSIARVFARYKHDRNLRRLRHRVNRLVTGCIYGGTSYGWLAYFRQMNDIALLKQLDVMIEKMKRRYGVSGRLKNKIFVRAYWSLKHPHGKDQHYIPNYDLFDLREKREVLAAELGDEEASRIADGDVDTFFERLARKLVTDLEKDIGHLS